MTLAEFLASTRPPTRLTSTARSTRNSRESYPPSQCEDRSHSNPLSVEPGPHYHGAQNNILEPTTRPKISSRSILNNHNEDPSMEDAAPAKDGKVKTENIGKGNLGANNGEHCYVCNITTKTKKDAISHRQSQAHCKTVSIARRGAMALLRMLQIPLYDNFAPPFATAAYEKLYRHKEARERLRKDRENFFNQNKHLLDPEQLDPLLYLRDLLENEEEKEIRDFNRAQWEACLYSAYKASQNLLPLPQDFLPANKREALRIHKRHIQRILDAPAQGQDPAQVTAQFTDGLDSLMYAEQAKYNYAKAMAAMDLKNKQAPSDEPDLFDYEDAIAGGYFDDDNFFTYDSDYDFDHL